MADRTFAISKYVKLRRLSLGPLIHTSGVVGKSSPNLGKESKQRQKQTKYDTLIEIRVFRNSNPMKKFFMKAGI